MTPSSYGCSTESAQRSRFSHTCGPGGLARVSSAARLRFVSKDETSPWQVPASSPGRERVGTEPDGEKKRPLSSHHVYSQNTRI